MSDWRILVVDDERDGREVVSGILDLFNISSDTVSSAEQAVALLSEREFTAAIIDLMLPGMHGTELVKEIRDSSVTGSLPCIAITAYHSSVVRKEAIEAGFDAYFAKPVDEMTLFRALTDIISNN